MRITHLGHACIRVDAGGDDPPSGSVLIDPGVFSPDAAAAAGDIDVVLITHQHADHVDAAVLSEVVDAADVPVLAEAGAARVATEGGVPASRLEVGETHTWGGLTVQAVGGEHAVIHDEIPQVGNIGLVIDDGQNRLFHPGDSYATVPAGIDVLALPLNAPWAKLSETIEFARAVGPRLIVPIHDHLLRPEARGIYLGKVEELCRAGMLDPEQGVSVPLSG